MPYRRTTFSKFVIEDLRRKDSQHDPELAALLNDLQRAAKLIGAAVSRGALDASGAVVTTEQQMPAPPAERLDEVAQKIMIAATEWGGQLCGMLSGLTDTPYDIPAAYPRGRYLLIFDPLDGAGNLDIGLTVGTFFSVLRAPEGVTQPRPEDFLQKGRAQVAAGYALFGPAAMMVITLGAGVHGFTLDRDAGAYTLTHPNMRIPEHATEFAIDAANQAHWERPVRLYVDECTAGAGGARGERHTMRWIDSMIPELHRILLRGGVFLMPRDTREHGKSGHAKLLSRANPVAFLTEQAGGMAVTGRAPVLDVQPESYQQRTPLIFGSRHEVERLLRYHALHDSGEDHPFETPLFRSRSLFRSA